MSITTIYIRRLSEQGPSVPGELLAICPVARLVTNAEDLNADIELPPDFAFPDTPLDVALYTDTQYVGSLILDRDGFRPHPKAP